MKCWAVKSEPMSQLQKPQCAGRQSRKGEITVTLFWPSLLPRTTPTIHPPAWEKQSWEFPRCRLSAGFWVLSNGMSSEIRQIRAEIQTQTLDTGALRHKSPLVVPVSPRAPPTPSQMPSVHLCCLSLERLALHRGSVHLVPESYYCSCDKNIC